MAEGRRRPLRRRLALPPLGPVHASRARRSAPSSAAGSRAASAARGPRSAASRRGSCRRGCVGSRGSTAVTGPQLRARLGLRDTWFYVRRVSSTHERRGAEARTLQRRAAAGRDRTAASTATSARFVHAPAPRRRPAGRTDRASARSQGTARYSIHVGAPGRLPRAGRLGARARRCASASRSRLRA